MKKQKRQVGKTLRLEEVTERLLSNPIVRLGYERRGIMLLAERVLGTRAAAAQWLTSPQVGLGGKVPTELLQSAEGTPQVERLLKQMQR
jgi:uncharacterized protein (DUF2384 family)